MKLILPVDRTHPQTRVSTKLAISHTHTKKDNKTSLKHTALEYKITDGFPFLWRDAVPPTYAHTHPHTHTHPHDDPLSEKTWKHIWSVSSSVSLSVLIHSNHRTLSLLLPCLRRLRVIVHWFRQWQILLAYMLERDWKRIEKSRYSFGLFMWTRTNVDNVTIVHASIYRPVLLMKFSFDTVATPKSLYHCHEICLSMVIA